MAIQFVTSTQVLEINGDTAPYTWPNEPTGITKSIPCKSEVMGFFWMVPKVQGNRVIGYSIENANDNIKPRPDAVKILRLKDAIDANIEYGIAVADGDGISGNTFVDKCNGCCGATPSMDVITWPTPILQLGPQETSADRTERTWVFPFPENPGALEYLIPYPWFNGTAPVTPYAGSGITTAAQFVTLADSNWGDYGDWSSSGNVVSLLNTDSDVVVLVEAGMAVSLKPKVYCFDVSTMSPPAAVNGIKFGSSPTFTFRPFILTGSNQQTLINSIKKFVTDGVFVISSGHLQVSTTQALPHLYNNTSVVLSATVGAC